MPPHIQDTADPDLADAPTLHLDRDGILWLDYEGVRERLGHIDDADVPRDLRDEHDRLRVNYRDSLEAGHEGEAVWTYGTSRGW